MYFDTEVNISFWKQLGCGVVYILTIFNIPKILEGKLIFREEYIIIPLRFSNKFC